MSQPWRRTADLPLAVWPCAQQTSQWQRHGRYLPESNRHPGKMLPALARKAIETYSDPGDLVLDPMCGIGTTLVEAIHLGRRAVGIELEERWAKLAVANIVHAREQGAPGQAGVILGDARALPRLLASKGRDLVGRERRAPSKVALLPYARNDLLLTAPPYAGEVGEVDGRARGTGENLCAQETRNYGADGSNLGHARGQTYLSAMAQIYGACAAVLRPGGFLVVVTKNLRAGGALHDLAGETVDLCRAASLLYWQHVIALLAAIRAGELPRPSFWRLTQTRKALARGDRIDLVVYEDVLVFRKPPAVEGKASATDSARLPEAA